ncbi:MAG: bile acid:sodium symporter family protein [Bacteroidales bacterium]
MIRIVKQILLNRNTILVFAVLAGIIAGDKASLLKGFTFPALAITMTFSMTGMRMNQMLNISGIYKPMLMGILLNYVLFSLVLLPLAWWLMPTPELFYGFVVIAAAPPGVAIIPFSYILKGDVVYAIISVVGAFIGSIFIAPLLVNIFVASGGIDSLELFLMMVQLVVLPLLISRFLLWKPLFRYVEPIRGKVVDWGFAILIFVAVGLNREVFFTNHYLLLKVSAVLLFTTFVVGFVYSKIAIKVGVLPEKVVTQSMLVAIKSSGFSVFTALSLFGKEAAIPSAVMAVVVLLYLIYLSLKSRNKE